MSDYEAEATEAKAKLGIGVSIHDRIAKLKKNQFQYATAGDTKALIEEVESLRAAEKCGRVAGLREAAAICKSDATEGDTDFVAFTLDRMADKLEAETP